MEDVIEEKESARDLGVVMQNDSSFTLQIEKAGAKARQKAGWIHRTFWFMRHMWNTLVAPTWITVASSGLLGKARSFRTLRRY